MACIAESNAQTPFFRARWIRGWRSRQETAFSAPGSLLMTYSVTPFSTLSSWSLVHYTCGTAAASQTQIRIFTLITLLEATERGINGDNHMYRYSPYTFLFPAMHPPRSQSRSQSIVGRAATIDFCVWAWLSRRKLSSRNPRVELDPLGSAWGWDGRQQREGTVELLQPADILSMFGCAMNPV